MYGATIKKIKKVINIYMNVDKPYVHRCAPKVG
jgi:hypothetical protein